jgi:xylan 1,4-beta-xylosidase
MIGPSIQLVNGGVDLATRPIWIEGPHLFAHGGWYYLTAAEGGTGTQHSQVIFRSRRLTGPYVPGPNPILTQRDLDPARPHPVTSAGHAKFVQTPAGDWWATFLATRPYADDHYNIGRETFLLPVRWENGWPQILPKGKPIPLVAPAPALPAGTAPDAVLAGDAAYRDSFDAPILAPGWVGIRTPAAPPYRIERGDLVLAGAGKLGDVSAVPAFVGRRLQHHRASVATTLTFAPAGAEDRAGLVALQNDGAWLFYGLQRVNGTVMLSLVVHAAGMEGVVHSEPAPAGPLELAIRFDNGRMHFEAGSGGQRRSFHRDLDARFLSTHEAGGFVGTVVGPYAYVAR